MTSTTQWKGLCDGQGSGFLVDFFAKNLHFGISLVVQQLRLQAPSAGGGGSVPGGGTKIPMVQPKMKKKKKRMNVHLVPFRQQATESAKVKLHPKL